MTNEARAILIAAAILSGVSGSAGFVGGRASAPVEVRHVAPVKVVEPKPVVEAVPLPRPRPKAEAKPKHKGIAKKKPRVVHRQRRPTSGECQQMRNAGRPAVKIGGRIRGYSAAQIDRALRDCGL